LGDRAHAEILKTCKSASDRLLISQFESHHEARRIRSDTKKIEECRMHQQFHFRGAELLSL